MADEITIQMAGQLNDEQVSRSPPPSPGLEAVDQPASGSGQRFGAVKLAILRFYRCKQK